MKFYCKFDKIINQLKPNRMIPFCSPYQFYYPFVEQNLYSYPPLLFQFQQKQTKATEQIAKQEQQYLDIKIQEKSQQSKPKIKVGPEELQKQGYQVKKRLWTQLQDNFLVACVDQQHLAWKQISKKLTNRNPKMCYNRYKRLCKKRKVLWSKSQDQKLKHLVQQKKIKWKHLQKHFEDRKAKQLRQRYLNFLRSNITREPWALEQDLKIIECINSIGKKWKQIEKILTNRSQNQIKNRYYGRIQHILRKKEKSHDKDSIYKENN